LATTDCQPLVSSDVMSKNEYDRTMREVMHGRQVAYSISLMDKDKPAGDAPVLDPRIQAVIDKHSTPGGTLCGDIPKGAKTAKGFSMHIHLKPHVTPIHVRQYRLTPIEREELISRLQTSTDVAGLSRRTRHGLQVCCLSPNQMGNCVSVLTTGNSMRRRSRMQDRCRSLARHWTTWQSYVANIWPHLSVPT
jgi:hypothetical protein